MFYFYSPIPPIVSGTATYFEHIIEYILTFLRIEDRATIVINDTDYSERIHNYKGIPVVDFRSLDNNSPVDACRFFFAANNSYHSYIYECLEMANLSSGKNISIIHDASVFMLHRWRYGNGDCQIDYKLLEGLVIDQYGLMGKQLLRSRMNEEISNIFEYVSHCQGNLIAASHEIWTHSVYAANKIMLERFSDEEHIPKMRICRHPQQYWISELQEKSDNFIIGVFGFITKPKRILIVILALSLTLNRFSIELQSRIKLRIVGNVKDEENEIYQLIREHRLENNVEFVGQLETELFNREINRCDLIVNLRFPSNGETSGVASVAKGLTRPVILSRYQAQREMIKGEQRSTTILPGFDLLELVSIIAQAANEHFGLIKQETLETELDFKESISPVEKVLMLEILNRITVSGVQTC